MVHTTSGHLHQNWLPLLQYTHTYCSYTCATSVAKSDASVLWFFENSTCSFGQTAIEIVSLEQFWIRLHPQCSNSCLVCFRKNVFSPNNPTFHFLSKSYMLVSANGYANRFARGILGTNTRSVF